MVVQGYGQVSGFDTDFIKEIVLLEETLQQAEKSLEIMKWIVGIAAIALFAYLCTNPEWLYMVVGGIVWIAICFYGLYLSTSSTDNLKKQERLYTKIFNDTYGNQYDDLAKALFGMGYTTEDAFDGELLSKDELNERDLKGARTRWTKLMVKPK